VKCDHLLMEQQDAEQRIAELERQLAQQKRIAELERQLANAKAAAGDAQPVRQPPLGYGGRGEFSPPRRKRVGLAGAGGIIGVGGGVIGACVGGAAALTALVPSSALWMSAIVCRGGYQMGYNTSHYSYKPGQSGTTVSFQCASGADSYDVNDFAVFALQSGLAALVLCVALAVGGLMWRLARKT
jgi:hypothetical protein